MLLEILGLQKRGERSKGNRLVRKPRLESLEDRWLMYGANVLAWNIMEPGALPVDAVTVGNVGGSLNASAVQAGEQICSSQTPLDPTAVEVRLLRRQYLASDENTVVGEILCIAAQNIENDNPESVAVQTSNSQLIDLTPSGHAVAEQTARAAALPNGPNTDLSHPMAVQVGQVQDDGSASDRVVASVNVQSQTPANVAITVGPGAEQLTSSTSSPQNSQAAHSQVVTIALKRRVRVVPPGSSGTSGTEANTNGGATTSGNSTSGNSASDNAPVTLPLNNQGGSSGGSGQDNNADSGTVSLSQIPNVLNLPASSHPASTGDSPTPSDNTSQPADPPPAETAATIGLGRLLLNAAGSGQAGSSSTGASGVGNTTGGASNTLPGTPRSLLTSAGQSTSGGGADSSMSWPDLVDMALTAPPVDATPACLRSEFCLLRL